jgi:integrase
MAAAGLSGVHFHDLRHTGNTLTAQAGATLADLMARMRPASTRAPLNTNRNVIARSRMRWIG